MRRSTPIYARMAITSSLIFATSISASAQTAAAGRTRLRFDTTEAVAVLALAAAHRAGDAPSQADWLRLHSARGYRRLQEREAAMQRAFTDSGFAAFVLSDTLGQRLPQLRRTLSAWERADLEAAAARAFRYLPADARIAATVYIVIKPRTNSFVWDTQTDPAIFLYLDPAVTRPKFENTVAHELHHIGLSSVNAHSDSILAALPDSVRAAAEWIGAFGEGFAMLAAAGGPHVHPHAVSPAADRARWDRDMTHFNRDLGVLQQFFWDVITRRLATPDTVSAVASTFYGEQGPWYTVGWKMAVLIEERFGRAELIRCMTDPARLFQRYNTAAAVRNRSRAATLAQWSPELVAALIPNR
jgi:putative zinc-dependent peptidase DUF5700